MSDIDIKAIMSFSRELAALCKCAEALRTIQRKSYEWSWRVREVNEWKTVDLSLAELDAITEEAKP